MSFRRFICICITISFLSTSIIPVQGVFAQGTLNLPEPGTMVDLSAPYTPVLIKGLKINPHQPLDLDFIVSTGDTQLKAQDPALRIESQKLIKYFFAALTLPENDVWVNLSPYEKDRIIPKTTGLTEMGRDMLAQDYMLKQITASLIYPEKGLGKEFWNKIYTESAERFGTTQVPVNTFNKVWIVADRASVYEAPAKGGSASGGNEAVVYVVSSHLKVMLEEDYLALQKHNVETQKEYVPAKLSNREYLMASHARDAVNHVSTTNNLGYQIVREIIIPALTQEVNEGKNFANLRQIFHSLILAKWYKESLKTALLNQVYSNKDKVRGVTFLNTSRTNSAYIYQQYLKAYKKGVFNYIREDINQNTRQILPRKYFSGGIEAAMKVDRATLAQFHQAVQSQPGQYLDFAVFAQSAPQNPASLKGSNQAMGNIKIKQAEIVSKTVKIGPNERPNLSTTFVSDPVAIALNVASSLSPERSLDGALLDVEQSNGRPMTIDKDWGQKGFFRFKANKGVKIRFSDGLWAHVFLNNQNGDFTVEGSKGLGLEDDQSFLKEFFRPYGVKIVKPHNTPKALAINNAMSIVLSQNEIKYGITEQQLAEEINKELQHPGTGNIPLIATISDQHGAINKFDSLLVDMFRQVPAGAKIPPGFVLNPDQTIAQQFEQFGIQFSDGQKIEQFRHMRSDFRGQLFIHNLGDFMDRGRFGVKVFFRSKELIDDGLSDFVIGNHDQWMFMNLIGYHLPYYDGFDFHGYHDAYDTKLGGMGNVKFVLETMHAKNPLTRTRSWWAEKLAEHRKEYSDLQESRWKATDLEVNGPGGLYDQVTKGMDEEGIKKWSRTYAGELWNKLRGENPEVGRVATGVRAVGLVSIVWWEDLLEKFEAINESLYPNNKPPKDQDKIAAYEAWQTAINLMKRIIPELKGILEERINPTDGSEPKWWYRIFEAINSQNYTSAEWWAQDWAYHKGWGPSVFEEINNTYHGGDQNAVTVKNYLDDNSNLRGVAVLKEIAQFYKQQYTLHIRDIMKIDLMHAFLPIDEKTGEFYFNYKTVHYRGKGGKGYLPYWVGLDRIAQDIRDAPNDQTLIKNIREAITVVNGWYADNTTEAKAIHMAKAYQKIGLRKIAEANDIHRLIIGHVPVHDFLKIPEDLGRIFTGHLMSTKDGTRTIADDDGGMNESFLGGGKYILAGAKGFWLRGYPGRKSTIIQDNPPTIIYQKNEKGGEEEVRVFKNDDAIPSKIFLKSVLESIQTETARNSAMMAQWVEIKSGLLVLDQNHKIGSTIGDTPQHFLDNLGPTWDRQYPYAARLMNVLRSMPLGYFKGYSYDRLDDFLHKALEDGALREPLKIVQIYHQSGNSQLQDLVDVLSDEKLLEEFAQSMPADTQGVSYTQWFYFLAEVLHRCASQSFLPPETMPVNAAMKTFLAANQDLVNIPISQFPKLFKVKIPEGKFRSFNFTNVQGQLGNDYTIAFENNGPVYVVFIFHHGVGSKFEVSKLHVEDYLGFRIQFKEDHLALEKNGTHNDAVVTISKIDTAMLGLRIQQIIDNREADRDFSSQEIRKKYINLGLMSFTVPFWNDLQASPNALRKGDVIIQGSKYSIFNGTIPDGINILEDPQVRVFKFSDDIRIFDMMPVDTYLIYQDAQRNKVTLNYYPETSSLNFVGYSPEKVQFLASPHEFKEAQGMTVARIESNQGAFIGLKVYPGNIISMHRKNVSLRPHYKILDPAMAVDMNHEARRLEFWRTLGADSVFPVHVYAGVKSLRQFLRSQHWLQGEDLYLQESPGAPVVKVDSSAIQAKVKNLDLNAHWELVVLTNYVPNSQNKYFSAKLVNLDRAVESPKITNAAMNSMKPILEPHDLVLDQPVDTMPSTVRIDIPVNPDNSFRVIALSSQRGQQKKEDMLKIVDRILSYDLIAVHNGQPYRQKLFKGQALKWAGFIITLEGDHVILDKNRAAADAMKNKFIDINPANQAMNSFLEHSPVSSEVRGGIDFNASRLNLSKSGPGVDIKFDPAMIVQLREGHFDGIEPVITRITPIANIYPVLGLKDPNTNKQLALL